MSSVFEDLGRGMLTRRSAIAGGAAMLAGASVTRAIAQDATPVPGESGEGPTFLFVQLADAGTWTVSPENPDEYVLTLAGVPRESIYFSDRPDRIVGAVPTVQLLEGLGFTPANPPNAAVVVRTPEGERDVLVVELYDPVYTESFGSESENSITYRAQILDAYHGDGLVSWYEEQDDPELPTEFTDVSLFIDDCADLNSCWAQTQRGWVVVGGLPTGPVGQCWNWDSWTCGFCDGSAYGSPQLSDACNAAYPGACGGNCLGFCPGGACGGGGPIL
jgi:hypothetical protein